MFNTVLVSLFILSIKRDISVVLFLVISDNFLISTATTENPFPCSPALAASIAALRAKRLV
ncbi:hypothetical protein D3C73_1481190 [compost metagenome]